VSDSIRERFRRYDDPEPAPPPERTPEPRPAPAWHPTRLPGETDADYASRYYRAEFQALLDGTLKPNTRARYTDRWGDDQWADPTGHRSWS
jgi:hypothetical protein